MNPATSEAPVFQQHPAKPMSVWANLPEGRPRATRYAPRACSLGHPGTPAFALRVAAPQGRGAAYGPSVPHEPQPPRGPPLSSLESVTVQAPHPENLPRPAPGVAGRPTPQQTPKKHETIGFILSSSENRDIDGARVSADRKIQNSRQNDNWPEMRRFWQAPRLSSEGRQQLIQALPGLHVEE